MIDHDRNIKLYRILFSNKPFLGLDSYNDPLLFHWIEEIPGIRWSDRFEIHMMMEEPETVRQLLARFRDKVWLDLSDLRKHTKGRIHTIEDTVRRRALCIEKQEALSGFERYLRVQRYSPRTIKNYTGAVELFLKYFNEADLKTLNNEDILEYNDRMLIQMNKSASSQRQFTGAIKHFFIKRLKTAVDWEELEYARKSYHLPTVLSKEEVVAMIQSVQNDKHRLIILTLYAQGLRRAELLDIRLNDIDLDRESIHVRNAKGNKDRSLPLSKVLKQVLIHYLQAYRPEIYLLNGKKGEPYSGGSIGKVVKRAAHEAGIKKKVTPHTLRHSYATHCLELGMGLRYIQTFLGHKSPKTTMIYTHIRNDKIHVNPLDELTREMIGADKFTKMVTKGDLIPQKVE